MEKEIFEFEEKIGCFERKLRQFEGNTNHSVQQLYDINNQILMQMVGMLGQINEIELKMNRLVTREKNIRYEIEDDRNKGMYFLPKIRTQQETLEAIQTKKASLARFGDGEFSLMFHEARHKFQKIDDKLAERLKDVLTSRNEKLLVGIADNYGTLEQYTESGADGIRDYMTHPGVREKHCGLLDKERIYENAYITRPYVLYKDLMTEMPRKRFEQWKQVWKNREVIIVEGEKTRVGVKNDLLSEAFSIKRILGPAESAFDRYDDIVQTCLEYANQDTLFLIALGPTAGVLAYDLTIAGYQALDIGHLDLEYEWFLAGKGERVNVPYKYNNEIKDSVVEDFFMDAQYETEILQKII